MNKLPCLLIGFARPQGIIRNLESCISSGVKKIYVSLDGPTTKKIEETQLQLISDLKTISKKNDVEIVIRVIDENLGSGAAVISSVNWLMSHEDAGIILEDDLEVGQDFFRFLNSELEFHQRNLKVLAISGFNPFLAEENSSKDLKVKYPVAWGWATTKEKWNVIHDLIFAKIPKRTWIHPVLSSYWRTGKTRSLSGRIDAWDVPFAASMRFSDAYSIIPPINLVTNIGSDSYATHTTKMVWPLGLKTKALPDYWEPKTLEELTDLTKAFEIQIYKIQIRNILSFPASLALDFIRFKGKREQLGIKSQIHAGRYIQLGKANR